MGGVGIPDDVEERDVADHHQQEYSRAPVPRRPGANSGLMQMPEHAVHRNPDLSSAAAGSLQANSRAATVLLSARAAVFHILLDFELLTPPELLPAAGGRCRPQRVGSPGLVERPLPCQRMICVIDERQ